MTLKPSAAATIEPQGRRSAVPREHAIKVTLSLSSVSPKFSDRDHVAGVAKRSLASFPGTHGVAITDVVGKAGRGGSVSIVTGVEGFAIGAGRPDDDSIEAIRASLVEAGYRVTVLEKRECSEEGCMTMVMIDWSRGADVPSGWFSKSVCGAHNYRTCRGCKSVFALSSINAAGQAPSVHCEVCGQVLVEWGSSKVWRAVLVSRA